MDIDPHIFQKLVEQGQDIAYCIDAQGHIIYISPQIKSRGLNAELLVGTPFMEYIYPPDQERIRKAFERTIRSGKKAISEFRMESEKNGLLWFEDRGCVICNPLGDIYGVTGFWRDITGYKQIEMALIDGEENLRLASQVAKFGIYDADLVAGTLSWSPELRTILGIRPHTPLPPLGVLPEFVHPDDAKMLKQTLKQAFDPEGNGVIENEHRIIQPDGSVRWILIKGQVEFKDENRYRKPIRSRGVVLDITMRKQAEESLSRINEQLELKVAEKTAKWAQTVAMLEAEVQRRITAGQALAQSEEMYRALVESAGEAICTVDRNGEFLFMNGTAARRLGGSPEDFIGCSMWDLFPREIADLQVNAIRQVIATSQAIEMESFTELKGKRYWYHTTIVPLSQAVNACAALVIARDISEYKEAQMKLENIARQHQLALDAAGMGWWHYDPITKMATWDDRYQDIFQMEGYQCSNATLLTERLHPEDMPGVWAKVNAALDPIAPQPYAAEYRIVLPDSSIRWIEARGIASFEGAGQDRHATSFVGTVADISERKENDRLIRENQEDLKHAQAVGNIGSWRLDIQNNSFSWSAQMYQIFGVPEGKLMTYENFLTMVHPEERTEVDTRWHLALRGEPYDIEHRIIVQDQIKWVREKAYLEFEPHGQLLGGFGITQDITDLKQSQAARQESDQMFKMIFDATIDGILMADPETKRLISGNPAICRMLGYDLTELQQLSVEDIHPREQLDDVIQGFEKKLDRGCGSTQNILLKHKDGHVFNVEVTGTPVIISNQKYMVGIFRDLTERNRLQQQIAEISDYEQRRIGRELHDGLQQELVGLAFKCETLAEILSAQHIQEAKEIRAIGDLLDHAVGHSRDLAKLLCPVGGSSPNSLVCALEDLAEKTESLFGISCIFKHSGFFKMKNPVLSNNLYRITQEAVTNAVKHGQARHILIHLEGSLQKINLLIKDDGVGLPDDYRDKQGLGCYIMQYRATMMGGTLFLNRDVELGGTVVMCSLPRSVLWESHHE